jgi:pyrimidine-nucleoside phosphorylase
MRAVDIIRKKRDGETLSSKEIQSFVDAATKLASGNKSDWEEYQLSALLMAIWLKDMNADETALLTQFMTDSGKRFDWSDLPGPKVDKHSTGGVGDKTSLILAPLAAACGCIVPMMSGRGLGHTGGTLDKLEAIPGFRVRLSEKELRDSLTKVGVGLIGQTEEVAPADKTLYSLRDVTGTVESIPLITASILSKKLAEGIDGLVMDVKCGVGAFMKSRDRATALAESIVRVGKANGLRTSAYITAMDAPLGRNVGHCLEVIECIEVLKGKSPGSLEDLSVKLAARMLVLGRLVSDDHAAERKIRDALSSGAGLEKFRQIIAQQGGDPRVIDDYSLFLEAPNRHLLQSTQSGYINDLNAEKIGIGGMLLGGGRKKATDSIDHGVGIMIRKHVGDPVHIGDTILEIHYRDSDTLKHALPFLESATSVSEQQPTYYSLILERFGD